MKRNNLIENWGKETSLSDDWGEKVKTNGKFFLREILTEEKHYRPMLLDNHITVLNKGVCGNGGTTSIIDFIERSQRGCLFLVPNVSIVKSKAEQYKDNPDICCVYGGVTDINFSAKIVIATYDQYKRLLSNLAQSGITGDLWDNKFWAGRAIFIDEYHKLVDEQFRDVMAEITQLIINTKAGVTLISATPQSEFVESLKQVLSDSKTFIKWDLDYENKFIYRMGVYEMGQSLLKGYLKGVIHSGNKYCVFINNISEVSQVLHNEGVEDCEILCSEENKEAAGEFYSDVYNPDKRVHFMTSAYFTGHDINEKVYKVVIVGGRSGEAMAISERDIKQILGRFRKYCNGKECDENGEYDPDAYRMSNIILLYLNERINITSHNNVREGLKDTNKALEGMGDKWVTNEVCIRAKLYNMYYNDTLKRLEYWMKDNKLIKKLRAGGYRLDTKKGVNNDKYDDEALPAYDIPDYVAEPCMPYKEAYTRIKNGEDITRKQYRFAPDIKAYFELEGNPDKMPTRDELINIVKIGKKITKKEEIKRISLVELTPDERYDVFDFKDNFRYKASRLLNCIKYIKKHYGSLLSKSDEMFGGEELKYSLLPFYMKEVFDCMLIRETGKDKKLYGSQDEWRVMRCNLNKYSIHAEMGKTSGRFSIIEKCPEKIPIPAEKLNISYLIGYDKTQKSNIGATINLNNIYSYISNEVRPLVGSRKYLYDWVQEDKINRLKEVKNSERWDDIKTNWQLMISELHRVTDKTYRHHKSECNTINCLMLDIDNTISLSKFKELYGRWHWLAYPTISNTASDWNKFRVIVPLQETLTLEGENNLKVLKALRTSFCVFEDACHNMGSYINVYDFDMKYINKGELYNISQNDVDVIQRMYEVKSNFISKKFDASEINISNCIPGAIERAISAIVGAQEGSRNSTISKHLYKLIKHLSVSDEQLEYIKQKITDYDKLKEFERISKYLRRGV